MNNINFMAQEFYSSGFQIPEGDYAVELVFKNSAPKEGQQMRLVVEVKAHDLNDAAKQGDTALTEQLGLGPNAHKNFAPNPETGGKTLIPVAGATGSTTSDITNWAIFRQSLINCGFPIEKFTEDEGFAMMDGMHVRLAREAEPASRKNMTQKAATGEAALLSSASTTENKAPKTVLVVTEIKDDGKPWEGGGGIPGGEAAAPAKPAAKGKPVVKAPPAKAPVKTVPAPAPAAEAGAEGDASDENDVMTAAVNAISPLLEKNVNGMGVLALRTTVFSLLKKKDAAMAQAVTNAYFADLDNLQALLEGMTFTLSADKKQIVPLS